MKKLFISAPMKGRTEAQIRATMEQMHHIAEAVFGEELEVIQTYISDDPPADANQAVWYLGESIKKMADADYFIGIYDEEKAFRGCAIENLVARSYNIPSYVINFGFVAPDVTEARAKANRTLDGPYGIPIDIVVGTFLIVGLTEDDFGELLPEFVEKYEKMFHQPRKFVTYTDSEGKAHLDVDYCTPEE